MSFKKFAAASVMVGGLAFASGPAAQADCHDGAVDASEFFVDGELDIAAYLAAVDAALAACAGVPVGELPATGVNSNALLPIALGLTAVGGAAVLSANHRRRSTTR